jgi:HD superfamily phosphodiesterase
MIDQAFKCVMHFTKKYDIDESHSLKHSMEVMRFAYDIFTSERTSNLHLVDQETIIIAAAILHDMCDRKYVPDEATAIQEIRDFMAGHLTTEQLDVIVSIVSTMSYSKVKKNGYPDLGEYQLAYHIVREADLLAAYDMDRCIIFGMAVTKLDYTDAFVRATELFRDRVMKYRSDGLFVTEYSKRRSLELESMSDR